MLINSLSCRRFWLPLWPIDLGAF